MNKLTFSVLEIIYIRWYVRVGCILSVDRPSLHSLVLFCLVQLTGLWVFYENEDDEEIHVS